MHSQIERFTPEKARRILDTHNQHNRPINRSRVRSYAAEMIAGRWKLSPEGISFGTDQQLINGQHVLSAMVEASVSLELYVHRQCPVSAFEVMDQGLVRTAAQVYAIQHPEAAASRFTSAARAVLELGVGQVRPSNSAIVSWAESHQDLLEQYLPLARPFTAGTHAAFCFATLTGLRYVDAAANRLYEQLWQGDDDPMRALSRALVDMGGRDSARAKRARFYTTLGALQYVDAGEGLSIARKYDSMPTRVRKSVRPELAA